MDSGQTKEESFLTFLQKYETSQKDMLSVCPTEISDRKELTSMIRKNGLPDYSPDKWTMDRRAEMKTSAKRALFDVAVETLNNRGILAMQEAGFPLPRAMQRAFAFADMAQPDGKKKIDEVIRLTEAYVKSGKTDEALKAEISAARTDIWNSTVKYVQDHASEYENLFAREMTDEELIANWPKCGVILSFYGEAEAFQKDDKDNSLLTQPLLTRYAQLSKRMDYLSSDLGALVDYDEFIRMDPDTIDEFIGNYKIEDPVAKDLSELGHYSVSQTRDQFLMGALRHFGIDPQNGSNKLLLQDMEGNVHTADSAEAWKLLYEKQEPVFAVPTDDPAAEPVLVQPLTREGIAATGDSFLNMTMPKIEPVNKPNLFVYGFHRFLSGIGKVFGADFGLESCRDYDKYMAKVEKQNTLQKNIEKAADRYASLGSQEKRQAASAKFAAHSGEDAQLLARKHEDFIRENGEGRYQNKVKESIRNIKDLEIRRINDQVLKLKEGFNLEDKREACEKFAEEVKEAAEARDSDRKLLANMVGNGAISFLFNSYYERKDEKGFSLTTLLDEMKDPHEISLAEKTQQKSAAAAFERK